ncbi:MAG TPA: hypothetical protein VMT61_02950 [Candidatus Binataceae bacterium]|nr:hypothetical protein [Candidatus Binataceae bacterium]
MSQQSRAIRRKNITDLARMTWERLWSEPMPAGWKVYLVRKTVIQNAYGRRVCGVIQRNRKTILIGRHTKHYSFKTLVHELAHLRTLDEEADHGPQWEYEFNSIALPLLGGELDRDI